MKYQDFQLKMCEFLIQNKTSLLHHELKQEFLKLAADLTDELYENYFAQMKNNNFLTWGGPPHKYSISDFGIVKYKEIVETTVKDKIKEQRDVDTHFYTKWTFIFTILTAILTIVGLLKCDGQAGQKINETHKRVRCFGNT